MDTTTSHPTPATPYATPHRARARRSRATIAGLAAVAVLGTAGVGWASATALAGHGTHDPSGISGSTAVAAPYLPGDDPFGSGTYGDGASGSGTYGDTSQDETTTATTAQQVGLAYIRTTVDYGSGEAAGTGMVLSSDGEVLTNHHVVEGATAIQVEIASTGETYRAEVVGYDAATDVALLKLDGASGLATVTPDTEDAVQVGDQVTGVGNALGEQRPSAAPGTVTAVGQSLTVSDESGGSEHLRNLIQVDADIVSGDSGGPLYDTDGEVVGMDTAASSGAADVTGYAIPIASALQVVAQIQSGEEAGTLQIGASGFLGVTLANTTAALPGGRDDLYGGYGAYAPEGVTVAGTVDGSAAADAGLTAGDTIVALDGTTVTSADQLSQAIAQHDAGDQVTLDWVDTAGQSQTATVTLGEGPVG